MGNNIKEEIYFEDTMESVNLAEGLDLYIPIEEDEEEKKVEEMKYGEDETEMYGEDETEMYGEDETEMYVKEESARSDSKCHDFPSMKINCDLEVGIGTQNKIIYVCPGKAQYFTASAICCSGDEEIEIEFCDQHHKCKHGKIKGNLGYYKIVRSGIIFIPYHNLSEYPDDWYPTDILTFKAESKCDKDVKFDVVFTFSRCVDCECGCNKKCRG